MANIIVKGSEITQIIINRPEKHNALDYETLQSLSKSISLASSNDKCKAIIISGAGGRAFSAGADVSYLYSISSKKEAIEAFEAFYSAYKCIWDSPKPTIAAISGYCLGGGNELAISCDFRIATRESVFSQPEVKLGIIPGGGATYRLPILIGLQNARRMILQGENFTAEAVLAMGLVDAIAEKDAVAYAKEFALELAKNPISRAKVAINSAIKLDYENEKRLFIKSVLDKEAKSAMAAFLNHKK
ncbi:enoyl-CoA hydratase/isomerase family protein [Candidatus Marsarchaeota archaeon]|nr:enoyl-CoA hydratase/isomerase family protein [Candidatus Marsarchaeota archaeon]MCL5404379.1 enoyl-CoA hydratase/isomerase family protein [Candidatus Marsarchaeota archaeon]